MKKNLAKVNFAESLQWPVYNYLVIYNKPNALHI